MSEPSIFTKIINGEIPCHKVYEDDKTFAFLDINPTVEGHTLVIPKTEVEFIWDLSNEDYAALMHTVKLLGKRLREVFAVPYVGVKVMGTDVPHAHIHLLPFRTSAEYKSFTSIGAGPDHDALAKLAEKIRF
jgi:histidine triad (HIT) family protein